MKSIIILFMLGLAGCQYLHDGIVVLDETDPSMCQMSCKHTAEAYQCLDAEVNMQYLSDQALINVTKCDCLMYNCLEVIS